MNTESYEIGEATAMPVAVDAESEDSTRRRDARTGVRAKLTLPDTESLGNAVTTVMDGARDTYHRLWSAVSERRLLSERPASPKEIIGYFDASSSSLNKVWGKAALVSSLMFYAFAWITQRFTRTATVAIVVGLFLLLHR